MVLDIIVKSEEDLLSLKLHTKEIRLLTNYR
jgi:hypothetical protein